MKSHTHKIVFFALVYVVLILLFSYFDYTNTRSELMKTIDERLKMAVYSTRMLLGENFHDNLTGADSIDISQDRDIAQKLHQYARQVGLAYVYSLKEFNGEIRFVVSSATDDEVINNNYQRNYYASYDEMDSKVVDVFREKQAQFVQYTDRWGDFRSLFMPFQTKHQQTYVIGADISLSQVHAVIKRSVAYTIMMGCFIGLLLVPLLLSFLRSVNREWSARYRALFIDSLTGLSNRSQLIFDLESAQHPHLAFIDINKFRDISNTYGPAIGDSILKQFACRLDSFEHNILKSHNVYRVNGDVFAILEDQEVAHEHIQKATQQLIKYLVNHSYWVDSRTQLQLNVTIGGVHEKEDAMILADMALDEAKHRQLNAFVFAGGMKSLPQVYQKNLRIKTQLLLALKEGRLVPFFQPIVKASNFKVVKYECLARIIGHDNAVQVPPDVFLPVAKRARIYPQITRTMIKKSFAMAKSTQKLMSINLNVSDMLSQSTAHFILKSLRHFHVGQWIQFEILETEAISNQKRLIKFIKNVQKMGVKVGVDDFGRSYSNFDRIIALPIDFVKLDRSIIEFIVDDKAAQKLIRNIVKMAHKNGIEVTAEYCHNQAVTDMAVSLGVDYLQGFYLGKPAMTIDIDQGLPIVNQAVS